MRQSNEKTGYQAEEEYSSGIVFDERHIKNKLYSLELPKGYQFTKEHGILKEGKAGVLYFCAIFPDANLWEEIEFGGNPLDYMQNYFFRPRLLEAPVKIEDGFSAAYRLKIEESYYFINLSGSEDDSGVPERVYDMKAHLILWTRPESRAAFMLLADCAFISGEELGKLAGGVSLNSRCFDQNYYCNEDINLCRGLDHGGLPIGKKEPDGCSGLRE